MPDSYRTKLRKIAGLIPRRTYKRKQMAHRSSQRKAYADFVKSVFVRTPPKVRKAPKYRSPLKIGQNNKGRTVYSGPKGGVFVMINGHKRYKFPGYTKFR